MTDSETAFSLTLNAFTKNKSKWNEYDLKSVNEIKKMGFIPGGKKGKFVDAFHYNIPKGLKSYDLTINPTIKDFYMLARQDGKGKWKLALSINDKIYKAKKLWTLEMTEDYNFKFRVNGKQITIKYEDYEHYMRDYFSEIYEGKTAGIPPSSIVSAYKQACIWRLTELLYHNVGIEKVIREIEVSYKRHKPAKSKPVSKAKVKDIPIKPVEKPAEKPTGDNLKPVNVDGREYYGKWKREILMQTKDNGFDCLRFGTYAQLYREGYRIRKGEKASVKVDGACLFHVSQCDVKKPALKAG